MISPHLLRIDASYSYRTYFGCLEGISSVQHCIEMAKKEVKKLWGDLPILVLDPTVKNKLLPRWTHLVWASGPELTENMDGSQLVICWWSELVPDTERVLNIIDWEKHAKDFQI